MKNHDEFDLEFDDIKGEVYQTPQENESIKVYEEEFDELTPEERDWQNVLDKLEDHCDDTWICVPTKDGKLTSKEIDSCDGETFFAWLEHVYPASKTMNHSAKDYDNPKNRASAFVNVITSLQLMQFPVGSMGVSAETEDAD
jgi:hypothetical protein